MKANAYSVACGGSVRVLKAGGRAARRVEDNISLWNDKRERLSHCCVIKQTSYLFHTPTACTRSSLNGGGVSTAQQIKAKSRITLYSSTCHTQSQQHNTRETHSLPIGSQLSALVMCLQYRTCEHSRRKRLLSTGTWAKAREYRE